MINIEQKIAELAKAYSKNLKEKLDIRISEMEQDDNSHYLIYRVLGITSEEGKRIDVYQNKGRFLYKYAGSFLEEATILCFEEKFKQTKRKIKIPNKIGIKPKTFEIDCLVDYNAYEVKWRDATTDGDHITKEHTRVQSIRDAGYNPIRIMFYYPLRAQAIKIQQTLETIYKGVEGEYYFGDNAWGSIKKITTIDLLANLKRIAKKNES